MSDEVVAKVDPLLLQENLKASESPVIRINDNLSQRGQDGRALLSIRTVYEDVLSFPHSFIGLSQSLLHEEGLLDKIVNVREPF